MIADDDTVAGPFGRISRRSAIGSTLLAGAAFLAPESTSAQEPRGAAAAVPSEAVRHEEVDQPVGVSLPAEDDARRSACSSRRTPASTASS